MEEYMPQPNMPGGTIPGLPGGGITLERRPVPQAAGDVPDTLYANDIGAQATDHDLTLDFANQHPNTGRKIGARVAMSWAMFDALHGLVERIHGERQKMLEAQQTAMLAEAKEALAAMEAEPEVKPGDDEYVDAEVEVEMDPDPEGPSAPASSNGDLQV